MVYSSRVPNRLTVHSVLHASCREMHNTMDSVSSLLHAWKGARLAGSKFHRQFEGGENVEWR